MKVEKDTIVPLGYGKYFRADSIVGMEPIEEDRGPGRRTFVYVAGLNGPVIASRSEGAILRDMTQQPEEVTRAREQRELLADILDSVTGIDPAVRRFITTQGQWNLGRLEEQIRDLLGDQVE